MLTDLSCKALITQAKHLGKPIKKADGNGLFLYAQPNGKAYWRQKYRHLGRENQISLGAYPLTSLSEARAKHGEAYTQITKGHDPAKLRKAEQTKAKQKSRNTFENVGHAWFQHNIEKWSEGQAKKILLILKKDLFKTIGRTPVADLGRKQILEALQKIEARKAHDTARRSRQMAQSILNYALDQEFVQHNIALGLEESLKPYKKGHYPSMDIEELPEFLRCMASAEDLSVHARDAIELLMLTLVRRNELLQTKWAEFDFEKALWVIPAPRMKMRKEHLVPLSRQAIKILLKRKQDNALLYCNSPYVFPAINKAGKPIYNKLVSDALNNLGYKDKHTAHGFRALGMGIAKEKLDYRHEVPDRQLAHVPAGEQGQAYDRAKFIPERVKMMQDLADYIDTQRA